MVNGRIEVTLTLAFYSRGAALNSEWTYSELTELTQICFSGAGNSDFEIEKGNHNNVNYFLKSGNHTVSVWCRKQQTHDLMFHTHTIPSNVIKYFLRFYLVQGLCYGETPAKSVLLKKLKSGCLTGETMWLHQKFPWKHPLCVFAFLLMVRLHDQYHSHVCTVNRKLEPADI